MNKNLSNIFDNKCNLYIYDEIPEMDGYSYINTPFEILDKLNEYSDLKEINLYINSGGGSVNTGFNIINLLSRYRNEHNTVINVYIDGMAGSMAGVLAIALADNLYLYKNSLLMIHLALTNITGNKHELMEMVEILDKCDKQLEEVFLAKAKEGIAVEHLKDMMKEETWLNYEDIVEMFNIKTILLDYCNNKTVLNKLNYEKLNIPKNKLQILIENKELDYLEHKLLEYKEFILNNQ